MTMQIGIRLHDTVNLPLEERLDIVREQGFSCAHLALSKVIKDIPVDSGALTPGFGMYLRSLFHEKKVDIAVLGCYLNLAHPDSMKMKQILSSYQAHIRFASILGCGVVGTETGAPNVEYQYEAACRSKEALDTLIQNLKIVVSYAEKAGVIFAIEPVINHIVYSPQIARQVLDEVNSPNLQVIFDPVNLLGMDNYMEEEQVIADAIRLLGDDIAVVHMKDFIIDNDQIISVAAGRGMLNYQPIIEFIKRKPMIHCTLENTNPKNAVNAREYIQSLWETATKME